MSIDEITEQFKNEDLAPPDLVKLGTILAGYYSFYAQKLKRIHLIKPELWLKIQFNNGEKPFSDKKTEMRWKTTEPGQKEIALEWKTKRIEKMVSSINKRLYVDNVAARNNY